MPALLKQLQWDEVLYPRNSIELGLDPYCWEVTSHSLGSNGYTMWNPKYHDGFNLIHRWVYWVEHPDFEQSLCVLHHCDNPVCVNPEHLFLGTVADNNWDRYTKGRGSLVGQKAATAACCKFDELQLKEIRDRYAAGETQRSLASEFGCTQAAISLLVNYKRYAK